MGIAQDTHFERDVFPDGGASDVRARGGDGVWVGIGREDGCGRARQLLLAGLRPQYLESAGVVPRPALEGEVAAQPGRTAASDPGGLDGDGSGAAERIEQRLPARIARG